MPDTVRWKAGGTAEMDMPPPLCESRLSLVRYWPHISICCSHLAWLKQIDQSGKRFIPVHPDSLPRVGPLWIATVIFSMSLWAFEVDELIGCQDRVITVIDHLTPRWTKWVAAQQRACSLESSALFHKHLAFYDWVLSELWSQSGLGLVWCCLDSADKS